MQDEVFSGVTSAVEAHEQPPSEAEPSPWMGLAPHDQLQAILREGKWTCVRRQGGHPVYKRTVLYEGEKKTKEQTFSHASTPSDHRSNWNAIRDLKKQDEGVTWVLSSSQSGVPALVAQLTECHTKRRDVEGELARIEEEITMIQSEIEHESQRGSCTHSHTGEYAL